MVKQILQAIEEEDLEDVLILLKSKDLLLEDKTCQLCENEIESIGGFIPKDDKIMPICDKIECTLKASFLIMKHNGNGNPVIEL